MARPSPGLLGILALLVGGDGWAQDVEEDPPETDEGSQEKGEDEDQAEDLEPAEDELVDPLQEKLLNSLDRPWQPIQVPTNSPKGPELPTNVLVVPEWTEAPEPLAEEEAEPVESPSEAGHSTPSLWSRIPPTAAITGAWFGLTGAQIGATFGTHWTGEGGGGAAGFFLGAPIGAVGGLAYGTTLQPSLHEATFLVGGGIAGAWTGYQFARVVGDPDSKNAGQRLQAMSSLGNLAGAGLAIGLAHKAPSWEITAGGVLGLTAGWQLAAGIGDLAGLDPAEQTRSRAGLELGLGYTLGGGLAYAHHRGLPLPDPVWTTVLLAEGAWYGGWLPYALSNQPTAAQRTGSLRIGMAGGYLASLAVTPFMEPSPSLLGLQGLGFSVGTLVGAGVPLSLRHEGYPRMAVIPMLIGGAAGQVVGTLVEPHYRLTSRDPLMIAVLSTWTGYQMAGWASWAEARDMGTRRKAGFVLTTAGFGTALAWGLPAVLDASSQQSVMVLSASLWGTWYGAWSGYLLQLEPDQAWVSTLTAGDVALLGFAAGSHLGLDPTWRQLGMVNAAGAAGAGFGALVGVLASPDPRTVGFASLVGTSLGLAGGTVLAVVRGQPVGEDNSLSLVPGLRRPRLSRVPFMVLPMAAPWVDEDGDVGVMLQLSALERETHR